ncbi:transcription termination factor 1-like isoform X2 [Dendropsophus ebraccatus]|uniref:transcription termination factor 1-like isoform X2 n=1 Tax=Dendropsophus ebraccatus TaxID=150705 RepID=UPI003831F99C
MIISPGLKHAPWDEVSSQGDTEDKVKKEMISLDVMYTGSSDVEGTPKKKKYMLNSETQDIETNPLTPKRKKSGDVHIEEQKDQEASTNKGEKRSHKAGREADDMADGASSSSIICHWENNEKIKKSHEGKDTKRLHKDQDVTKGSSYSEITDLEGNSKEKKKKKKAKKDHKEQLLDNSLVEKLSPDDTQHVKKKKKKKKGGEDLHGDGSAEESSSRIKSTGYTEISEQVDESQDLSEKALKKKKNKRKHDHHHHQDDMAEDDAASFSSVYQEKNKKIKKSHEVEDPKRLSRDDGLPEEALYKEPANIKDSLKKKKHHLLVEELLTTDAQHVSKKTKRKNGGDKSHKQQDFNEELVTKRKQQDGSETTEQVEETMDQAADRSVETLLISDTQPVKKKRKDEEGVQGDGLTEDLSSHRKSSDGSEAQEQVHESRDQIEKPKKRKKDESPQKVEDIALEDVSSSAAPCGDEASYDTEDRTRRRKKKKSKKDQSECPVEESNYDAQCTSKKKREKTKRKDGGDESHRPHETETVDQAEVYVRKKKKKKKHSHSREDTYHIRTEEMQPEDDGPAVVQQSSLSQEGAGNMEGDGEDDTEQTSTSGQSRHQTSVPTGAEQNPTTQDEREEVHNEGGHRPNFSVENTERSVIRRRQRRSSIQEQDLALIQEYFPKMKSRAVMKKTFFTYELEQLRMAKQKGILYRTGQFSIEEDELIKKNVEKFISEVEIQSAVMLFHPYAFPEHSRRIHQIKRKFKFKQRIGVIERGAKLFQFATRTGRYTEEEVKQLKKYHELHGKDYQAISVLMSRSIYSTRFKINEITREVNYGPWSTEETNRLITAVKEFIVDSLQKENNSVEVPVTIPQKKLYKGIKWVQIQEKVGTRGSKYCRAHWTNIISMRMNDGVNPFKGKLGRLTSIRMIKWLHDAKVMDYGDVKWDKLCDSIGNLTPFGAQAKLLYLKKRIKGYKTKRLNEIVDHLYNKTLPKLEAKVSLSCPVKPEIREEFLFSEMFREYSESNEL